jgi:hypothetical protein
VAKVAVASELAPRQDSDAQSRQSSDAQGACRAEALVPVAAKVRCFRAEAKASSLVRWSQWLQGYSNIVGNFRDADFICCLLLETFRETSRSLG